MWPEPVEGIAALLRQAGVEARLEELPEGEDEPPEPAVRAEAFHCDGRQVVALVPADRELDESKVAASAACGRIGPSRVPVFPYASAEAVLLERMLLTEPILWIEAGSPRHAVGLAPAQLALLARARPADLLQDT